MRPVISDVYIIHAIGTSQMASLWVWCKESAQMRAVVARREVVQVQWSRDSRFCRGNRRLNRRPKCASPTVSTN